MIRPVFTEVALFLSPFVAYALFVWLTRSGAVDPRTWSLQTLAWLTIAALAIMLGSFVGLAHFSGSPPGSTYTPAHTEGGAFKPGRTN